MLIRSLRLRHGIFHYRHFGVHKGGNCVHSLHMLRLAELRRVGAERSVKHGKVVFASSANPSGRGNSGRVAGIGKRIDGEAGLVIGADDFARSIQAGTSDHARYEQGVMVSMVDLEGELIPEQKGHRLVQPGPVAIRKGLDINKILPML
jgi:hypothetical protein